MDQKPIEEARRASLEIKVNLEVLLGSFRLRARGKPQIGEVPPGQIVVLSYGHEFADAGGLPEVYLAGEMVARDPLRRGAPCWAIQLAEFPGRVDIQLSQMLSAISQGDDDPASITISFYIRLHDPILLLRRTGGKWEKEADRSAFTQQVNKDIKGWLQALLERDIQVWSGDERDVLGRIFSELNEYLGRIGLRVDTTDSNSITSAVIFTRHYPSALYDLAFQFAKAERTLRHLLQRGVNIVTRETGLSEEEAHIITSSGERGGVAFFRTVSNASPEAKEQIARWMEKSGMPDAARFVRTLYFKEFREREIKLSEQVLLSAIRNPWLARGEWLKEMSESPVTRLQQIERKIKSLSGGS